MYSTNDWRSYELYHAVRRYKYPRREPAKWTWPGGNNSSAYNKWYYQAHKAYILARAKARRLGKNISDWSGDSAKMRLEAAEKRLNDATRKAIEKYGSRYKEDPRYQMALANLNKWQKEYNGSIKGIANNIQEDLTTRGRRLMNDVSNAPSNVIKSAKKRINNLLGYDEKRRLDSANYSLDKARTKASRAHGQSKSITADYDTALANQKAAQNAYNRTVMGMGDALQTKIGDIQSKLNIAQKRFTNTLNKLFPKKK